MQRNLWSSWSEYLNVSDTDTFEEFSEKIVPQTKSHVMKLPLKDMHLFGQCSEYDDFYLVICQICGKSIKPQSLKFHIELRHQKLNTNNLSRSVEKAPLITYLKPNCSSVSPANEDRLTKINNSAVSVSEEKEKLKILSNKRHTIYVKPYPRPSSVNSCQKRNAVKLVSHNPSSDMAITSLSRSIVTGNQSVNHTCSRKMSFPESSSSTCDSQTSMTVFLHHSFVMPNMKLCDIKDRHCNHLQCLTSKTLPEKNCLPKSTILTQVLPEKRGRQNVRSPVQVSQVHNSNEEVDDWSCIQNSTNVGLNRAYNAWNQHSSHFRPLPHNLPIGKSGQMNSHSFNCSDLSKKFDLESQVLIHNAAMGT